MSTEKDLFSAHSMDYAKFRPTYPEELFRYLASLCTEHACAWDCATGNGQAAILLARYFDRVIATDLSAQQIKSAVPHKKVTYYVATAENSKIAKNSVDIITVAQAFHWFDQEVFANEVARVAKKGAVLAIWCYDLATITPSVDKVINFLYKEILGAYWEPERGLVESNYQGISMPFNVLPAPSFPMSMEWTFEHLLGYLNTWSAMRKFIENEKKDPLLALKNSLIEAWGSHATHQISWELKPKLWRI